MMTKKLTSLMLALVMCLFLCVPAFAEDATENVTIPETMPANSIVTYSDDLQAVITQDEISNRPAAASNNEVVASAEELLAEEAEVAAIKDAASGLPVYYDSIILPAPVAGMTVLYGSDGEISHIYYPNGTQPSNSARANPGVGHTAAAGTYTYAYFGYMYSDTLSFPGRYHYNF